MGANNLINEKRPHDSASKHVTGYAIYTDDIKEPYGTLHGAIGWSKKAHANIKKIDLSEVWKSEGVVLVVGQKDIIGRNDVGPVFDGDPIFPKKKSRILWTTFVCSSSYLHRACKKSGIKS